MSDCIVRGILRGHELLVLAGVATLSAREARRRHGLASTSAQFLASGLMAGGMLSGLQKSDKTRINLQIECDGPGRGLFVDADASGRLRGYVRSKSVQFPGGPRFESHQITGTSGYVAVLRDVDGVFYRGSVGLEGAELSLDFENYFRASEQTETLVALEVLSEGSEELSWVGGVLVQRLPGADEEALDAVRERMTSEAVQAAVRAGARTPEQLIAALFGDAALETLEQRTLAYWCPCSRERVLRALQTLGPGELFDMIHRDEKAEVDCEFCGQHYEIGAEELQEILDMLDRAEAEAEAETAAAAMQPPGAPSPAKKQTLH